MCSLEKFKAVDERLLVTSLEAWVFTNSPKLPSPTRLVINSLFLCLKLMVSLASLVRQISYGLKSETQPF